MDAVFLSLGEAAAASTAAVYSSAVVEPSRRHRHAYERLEATLYELVCGTYGMYTTSESKAGTLIPVWFLRSRLPLSTIAYNIIHHTAARAYWCRELAYSHM